MYEFTEDCMIHIDNIDEEHRKLFQMLNEAFALVKETDNAASIAKNLIDNLKDYAITHFAHEEEYMKSIHDPELPIQQREHKAFAEKINTRLTIQLNSPIAVPYEKSEFSRPTR